MKFRDVEQNNDEWLQLRSGKITSSALKVAMANYGAKFGDPAKRYAINIALEQITGKPEGSGYSNEHMQRGHEEEPVARALYEQEYFCKVDNGGFFEDGDEGCSPDGLIGDEGLIEIKCTIPTTHHKVITRGSYDPAYKWQLVGNMRLTRRKWIDFVNYCSGFPVGKQLYVYRCYASDFREEYAMIDTRLAQFRRLIADSKDEILNSKYSIIGD